MTLVAPRIVNDLPYVSTVNHDIHFEWQAPYLLRCVGDACSIYFTGNICASCLCVNAHYTTKLISPRSISSSNIILRNSFHVVCRPRLSAGVNPRVSLWTSWMHNGKPRMSLRTAWLFEAMRRRTANNVVVRSKKLVCGQAWRVGVEG